ncbi:Zinc finger protein GIS2, partial [Bienertia sinuspersici]
LDESQRHEFQQHQARVDPTVSRTILPESNKGIMEDNVVLQKLLRRWRYFDCQAGCSYIKDHAVNTPARKEKPCFVCGKFQHTGKRCPKRRICCTCKKRGHIANDCPLNNKEYVICLRCGELGHELFSCNVEYSPDDLKNVRCYVCKELGHICCDNHTDISLATSSCYNCGESGHSGLQCPKPHLDKCGSRPPSICYKCGEDDHVARKCTKDPKLSAYHRFQQASEVSLGAEADVGGEYENQRRRRTYRHGRVKKQKMRGLLEYMS